MATRASPLKVSLTVPTITNNLQVSSQYTYCIVRDLFFSLDIKLYNLRPKAGDD